MRHKHDTVVEVSHGSPDINGRFERFNTKLGEGAFKRVYKAFDTFDQIDVAWNIIDLSSVNVDAEKQRIFRECDTLRKLHHPNILRITAQWWDEEIDHLNFITNLVHDGSLSKYFKNRKINLRRIKQIAQQILSALAYLHENGIIHRDLKGDNIFIEGSTGNIVIGDLGLSCNIVSARSIVGTPHYMAPDVYKEDYNELVDIWAFGMVILELITGKMPFSECKGTYQAYQAIISGKKPSILTDICNPYIRSFIDICLNTNATCRPSAAELLEHPFLFERLADRQLCSSFIKTKSQQYPEPPPSPEKEVSPAIKTGSRQHAQKPQNSNNMHSKPNNTQLTLQEQALIPPIDDAQAMTLPPSQIDETRLLQPQNPNQPMLSQEKVTVVNMQVINTTQIKLEIKIFSHSFANQKNVMTVAFTYDTRQDSPDAVANEMVQTLKLKHFFVAQIRDCILNAIESIPSSIEPQTTSTVEKTPARSTITAPATTTTTKSTATAPSGVTASTSVMKSKQNERARAKHVMEEWLTENGLEKLIPTFNEEKLTIEHLRCIANDAAMIQRLCDDMKWDIFVQIKLKKAVLDLHASESQRAVRKEHEAMANEHALILDELNEKHSALSNDLKQMKDAANEITRSANECSQAVRQNTEALTQLIEQDRDRLLQLIEETKERRKQQMEAQLNTLQTLSHELQCAQQQIASVIDPSNSESPTTRHRRIKSIVSKLSESEQQNVFDPSVVNQSDFKLRLDLDLQRFVDTLQSTMILRFSSETFETPLTYNNTSRNTQQQQNSNLSITTKSSDIVGGAGGGGEHSTSKSPVVKMQPSVVAIEHIELDFETSDFVLTTSSSLSPGALHPPNLLVPLKSLQLEHNINAAATAAAAAAAVNEPSTTQSPLPSSDSLPIVTDITYSNMRRAASADLMQSDYQDHHMSPIKPLSNRFNFAANQKHGSGTEKNSSSQQQQQLGVPLRMSKSRSICSPVIAVTSAGNSVGDQTHRGTRRRNTVHHIAATDADADALLVDGYIRHHCKRNKVVLLPAHLRSLSYAYYHLDCALLKFSKIYKSDQGWRLYDGNTCIKRLKVATSLSNNNNSNDDDEQPHYANYKWILADITSVFCGIHCWRLNVRNPNKGALVIGICPPQMLKLDADHQRLVYGIAIGIGTSEQCCLYPKRMLDAAQIFHQSQCQIDMKLNLISGQLCFVLVHRGDDTHPKQVNDSEQVTIENVPLDRYQGWVPYIKSYENSVGCQIKMATCPIAWYGRYKDALFE